MPRVRDLRRGRAAPALLGCAWLFGCAVAPRAPGSDAALLPPDDTGDVRADAADAGDAADASDVSDAPSSDIVGDVAAPRRFERCAPTARGCLLPPGLYVPELAAPLARVYAPAGDRYLNDHGLVRDDTGRWHVYGITATGDGEVSLQRQFLHATATALTGLWTDLADAVTLAPGEPGTISAPFVVRDGASYRMFYFHNWGSGGRLAHSSDLATWTTGATAVPGLRDQFVLRLDDGRLLLYTVGVRREADGFHDTIALFESRSLTDWSGAVETAAVRNPVACQSSCWGFYESPYVVEVAGYYYLFVTYTNSAPTADYTRTLVFRSSDPTRFDPTPIARLPVHAPELVHDGERMFITSCGWPSHIGRANRGLSLAPLAWIRQD